MAEGRTAAALRLHIEFPRHRVTWQVVPKAGLKSVNYALHQVERSAAWIASPGDGEHKRFRRFCVVRHPVERFESLYYQRVNWGTIDDYAMTFPESEMATINPHGMRQVDLVGTDLSVYQFVGRLEDMDKVARNLTRLFRRRVRIGHYNASVRGPKLTGEALELIREHYRADLETFGYT